MVEVTIKRTGDGHTVQTRQGAVVPEYESRKLAIHIPAIDSDGCAVLRPGDNLVCEERLYNNLDGTLLDGWTSPLRLADKRREGEHLLLICDITGSKTLLTV